MPISADENPLLYRAIRDKRWFKVKSAAFRLRGPTEQNPDGERDLSLILSTTNCTASFCEAGLVRYCGGEFVLETEDALATASINGWQVEKDAPNHASILGLPMYNADRQAIEDAATALADIIDSVQNRPS
jgi:hypothetical protein